MKQGDFYRQSKFEIFGIFYFILKYDDLELLICEKEKKSLELMLHILRKHRLFLFTTLFLKGQVANQTHPLGSSSCVSDVTVVLLCVHNYHFPKLAQEAINTNGKNVNFQIKKTSIFQPVK